LQFSLRTLLVVSLAAAVWLGAEFNSMRRQFEAVAAWRALGGTVEFDADRPPSARSWLAGWLGDEHCRRVQHVFLAATRATDADLAHFAAAPDVESISLVYTQVTDGGLEHLSGLKRLRTLDLRFTQVTPQGAARLREALPRARIYHESDIE
jgi:hypothetical protein